MSAFEDKMNVFFYTSSFNHGNVKLRHDNLTDE